MRKIAGNGLKWTDISINGRFNEIMNGEDSEEIDVQCSCNNIRATNEVFGNGKLTHLNSFRNYWEV